MSSGTNPVVVGQGTTLTATVVVVNPGAGTPTGSVEFLNNGVAITGCTAQALSGTATDTATCSFTPTASGSDSITAIYAGNSLFLTSTSTAITETVNLASATATVATSVTPAVVGQSVTYTATVTATSPSVGIPPGNVEFLDGGTAITACGGATGEVLGGGTPDTATCQLAYATTSGSPHSITVKYLGSSGAYNASAASAAITETVNTAATTTAVASSKNPSSTFQTVTYTATVTATSPSTGTPTGNVEFLDGGTAVSTCGGATGVALGGGTPDTATCAVTYTTTGSHTITAKYLGAALAYTTSTSSALTQTVSTSSSYSSSNSNNLSGTVRYYPINGASSAGGSHPSSVTVVTETTATTLTSLTVTLSGTSTSATTITVGTESGNGNGTFTAFTPTSLTVTVPAGSTTAQLVTPISVSSGTSLEVTATGGSGVTATWVTTYTQP